MAPKQPDRRIVAGYAELLLSEDGLSFEDMKVILEIGAGTPPGKETPLKGGHCLRVGRSSQADYAFPQDRIMSSVHFELECNEERCRIRDLKSTNGTFVNGERITQADLNNGDKIVAGQTHFSVRFEKDEGEVPPRSRQPAPIPPLPPPIAPLPVAPLPLPKVAVPALAVPKQSETPPVLLTPQERLLATLRGELQPLYALLDAAVEPDVLRVLYESKEERQSLFEGVQGARLVHFAPHLVRLPQNSPLLETLVRKAWGKNWGVYIACAKPLPELRAHLRQFLLVKVPGNKQMHFRYYDPRILRVFLPTCFPEEINQFFGPVKYFVMEDKNPEVLLRFSSSGRGVELKPLPLAPRKEGQGAQI
jgi:pSer/pThr/pTyr-binding forkhead associated (FHA) protein